MALIRWIPEPASTWSKTGLTFVYNYYYWVWMIIRIINDCHIHLTYIHVWIWCLFYLFIFTMRIMAICNWTEVTHCQGADKMGSFCNGSERYLFGKNMWDRLKNMGIEYKYSLVTCQSFPWNYRDKTPFRMNTSFASYLQ